MDMATLLGILRQLLTAGPNSKAKSKSHPPLTHTHTQRHTETHRDTHALWIRVNKSWSNLNAKH